MAGNQNNNFYSENDALDINELASLNEDISAEFIEQLQNKVSQSASGFKQKTSDDTQLFEEVNTSTETKVVDTQAFEEQFNDNFIKKYKAKYSKDKNEIILLDNLPLMIENDLKDLFIPTLLEASSLPWQKRARIVPEYFFKEKSKNYFPFISTINEDEEVYLGYKYNEYPFLTIISGERGIGKTSKLAYLYETSKNEKMCDYRRGAG